MKPLEVDLYTLTALKSVLFGFVQLNAICKALSVVAVIDVGVDGVVISDETVIDISLVLAL